MPAELVLPALCGRSGRSRSLGSASAYHQAAPKSDEAYRPGEPSPAHPAPAPRRHGAYERWLLARDIQRGGGGQSVEWFFDNISHPWLLEHIPMDKRILQRWLQAGYIDEGTLFASAAGTPQGGIISPTLSNMTLDGLEAAVYASVGSTAFARSNNQLNVVRYADDFVVTGISKEVLESKVLPAVKQFMAARGLELSDEKTRITHISEGFDFLGQNVRKYNGKLLIKPAKKSVKSLLSRVREIVKGNASATQAVVIQKLNPVIRGWAMYHRHIVAKAIFSSIDSHIWHVLWKWAMRRHPAKGAGWVKNRYFYTDGQRSWDFATKGSLGSTTDRVQLFRAATISIARHVKIRALANPFDPEWIPYFTHRQTAKRSAGDPSATSPWC
jgi:RNA-directed DNA polymerase